jgi:hypothetical protein
VTRSIAIATEQDYQTVYDGLNIEAKSGRQTKYRRKSSARNGVYRIVYEPYLLARGWQWQPTMKIGSGCQVHLRADELPRGRLICVVSKHLCAVIDGIIHDLGDPSRGGTRCVYGFYYQPHLIDPTEVNS